MSAIQRRLDGTVLELTLANPPTNALSEKVLFALKTELETAENDPGVRAIILSAEGDRYFSSGICLDDLFSRPDSQKPALFGLLLETHKKLASLGKPVVAAISGRAILGGWILAMGCDFRIMAEESGKASLSEIRYGLTPTEILLRRILSIAKDPSAVKELVLRGKTFDASAAFNAGFVDKLVPAAELKTESSAFARSLAKSAPNAYAAVKAALNAASGAYDAALWEKEIGSFSRILGEPEAKEGLASMREKRKPRWE